MDLWLSSQRHLYESVEQTLTSLEIAEPEPYEGKGVGEAAYTFEGLLEKVVSFWENQSVKTMREGEFWEMN